MRLLYIDPGTGSMLFAILIGLIGALQYVLKSWLVKVRFRLNGGKNAEATQEKLPLVIFSDDKRYWTVFEPVCRELCARGTEVTYMTGSEDDLALTCGYEHLHAEFIGQGNKGFAKTEPSAGHGSALHDTGSGCVSVEAQQGSGLLRSHTACAE